MSALYWTAGILATLAATATIWLLINWWARRKLDRIFNVDFPAWVNHGTPPNPRRCRR